MNSSAPQIGFDRLIQLGWVDAVLNSNQTDITAERINDLLVAAKLGAEAKAKTRTKLNAFGLQPRHELIKFVAEGQRLCRISGNRDALVSFAWGVAIATYPFFGKVAEFVGRLSSLQGDCAVSEIHRRMSEIYGDRAVTKRATQTVLQTQSNWGVINRIADRKRVIRLAPTAINTAELTAWLIEAALRYAGKPLSTHGLQSIPVLFPFNLTQSLAYVVSNSKNLRLLSEGPINQFVVLKEW